jgi:hypothetical protein
MSVGRGFDHAIRELGLSNLVYSFELDIGRITKTHDAIHQFMLFATSFFPPSIDRSWHSRSAFLLYHQEFFHIAHRSLLESLMGSYHAGFVLMRSSLEMILRGAFYEALAHERFRKNSNALEKDRKGKELKLRINEVLTEHRSMADECEKTSAGILDVLGPITNILRLLPATRTLVLQLDEWRMFRPVGDPFSYVYGKIYHQLSDYVHALPDMTDIGTRLLLSPEALFNEDKLFPDKLKQHLELLHEIVDVGFVVMINVLIDEFEDSEKIKASIRERAENVEFKVLDLRYASLRLRSI